MIARIWPKPDPPTALTVRIAYYTKPLTEIRRLSGDQSLDIISLMKLYWTGLICEHQATIKYDIWSAFSEAYNSLRSYPEILPICSRCVADTVASSMIRRAYRPRRHHLSVTPVAVTHRQKKALQADPRQLGNFWGFYGVSKHSRGGEILCLSSSDFRLPGWWEKYGIIHCASTIQWLFSHLTLEGVNTHPNTAIFDGSLELSSDSVFKEIHFRTRQQDMEKTSEILYLLAQSCYWA